MKHTKMYDKALKMTINLHNHNYFSDD